MNNSAKILKILRADRTVEEIAREIGVTPASWEMYERGERVPRDEVKIRISEYFGLSVDTIFFNH